MSTITRPTTSAHRALFTALDKDARAIAVEDAKAGVESGLTVKEAWEAALAPKTHSGGMPAGHTFQRSVGHRLVSLRAKSAECSCGKAKYTGEGSTALRAAHAKHKAKVA